MDHHCVACCYDTEMPLLEDDVKRLQGLGFKERFFVREKEGFKVLKNSNEGRCVFHDGKQCTIYENRPAGCKLYPVIFDEDLGRPVRDSLCPYRKEFNISLKSKKELSDVYGKLMSETQPRVKKVGKKLLVSASH
ncbi:MAG: YkgJ family cysteine cluster protein [Nitrososphaerales archaeon]|jgi:uncharacterized protein